MVPELTLTTSRRDIVICPLEVEGDLLTREVGLALREHSRRSPAVAAMVSVLTSLSRDFGGSKRRRSRPTGSA